MVIESEGVSHYVVCDGARSLRPYRFIVIATEGSAQTILRLLQIPPIALVRAYLARYPVAPVGVIDLERTIARLTLDVVHGALSSNQVEDSVACALHEPGPGSRVGGHQEGLQVYQSMRQLAPAKQCSVA